MEPAAGPNEPLTIVKLVKWIKRKSAQPRLVYVISR
jgi:hypothetical protein